jgi:hypothetical protein
LVSAPAVLIGDRFARRLAYNGLSRPLFANAKMPRFAMDLPRGPLSQPMRLAEQLLGIC